MFEKMLVHGIDLAGLAVRGCGRVHEQTLLLEGALAGDLLGGFIANLDDAQLLGQAFTITQRRLGTRRRGGSGRVGGEFHFFGRRFEVCVVVSSRGSVGHDGDVGAVLGRFGGAFVGAEDRSAEALVTVDLLLGGVEIVDRFVEGEGVFRVGFEDAGLVIFEDGRETSDRRAEGSVLDFF